MTKLTLSISPSELQIFFISIGIEDMTISACLNVVDNIIAGRVSQIIFDFGIEVLQGLVIYLEENEEWEALVIVRDKLKVHNKLTDNNYKLKNEY